MYKICVFAGTTEGRTLAEFLCSQQVQVTACVATEYGQTLIKPRENLTVSAKRLTEEEMENLFSSQKFDLVLDATHPYAPIVTENIFSACEKTSTRYLRLLRDGSLAPEDGICCDDISGVVDYLNTVEGNILLTTGSKELIKYVGIRDFSERVYARVLPMEDSLRLCREAGLQPSHILAMQGPFSQEMNSAMLKAVDARFMVTKASGTAGGFEEKIASARQAGAELIVIGRPAQRPGMSYAQVKQTLCRDFSLTLQPRVTVVGIGPGSHGAMTHQVMEALQNGECIIGARRMLGAVPGRKPCFDAIAPQAIAQVIHSHPEFERFVVVMSGDVGFFSGTRKLLPLLQDCHVTLLPGLNALTVLASRLHTSYEDVVTVSAHGRDRSILPEIRRHHRIFTLLGGENGAGILCQQLTAAGMGEVQVSVGENLSYENEKIVTGTARELSQLHFESLCSALIENEDAGSFFGLPDEAFQRGSDGAGVIPMTKSEVRAVALSKLQVTDKAVCWDIGSGTGSVSVEMALQALHGSCWGIERREEAIRLARENAGKFGTDNLTFVNGLAPEACRELPAPTHVFIGGSAGNLREIISLILEKNPRARIVATAIALESVAELTGLMKELAFESTEIVCLNAARDRKAGPYHLMTGQNPVYIFTMQGGDRR